MLLTWIFSLILRTKIIFYQTGRYFRQSTVDDHLSNIPEDREELQEFQAVVKSGLVQLEERDIHVIVTLISAQKHMEIADEKVRISMSSIKWIIIMKY